MKNDVKLAEWMKKVTNNPTAISIIEGSEERIQRAYKELLSGYVVDTNKILNVTEKVEKHDGLVMEKKIVFFSICGHHFLPFFGTVDVVYEPGKIITGLGKLPRLVQAFARRFQIQEFLVKEVAEQISKSIEAKGVYVRSKARHFCMCSRGPSDPMVETICDYSVGTLNDVSRQTMIQSMLQQ